MEIKSFPHRERQRLAWRSVVPITEINSQVLVSAPIVAMGPTVLTQICVSLLAESASDAEEETGATDASAGT